MEGIQAMTVTQRPRQDVVNAMNGRFLGSHSFPAVPESVREGRRWLAGTLTSALGPGRAVCDDGVLLLSEGLTNAILHGGGDKVEVGVFIYGDCVRVEILDEGGETVPHYVEDPSGERGRGLPIIQSLAREWGFERMDGGRLKVWFDVPRDGMTSTQSTDPTDDQRGHIRSDSPPC